MQSMLSQFRLSMYCISVGAVDSLFSLARQQILLRRPMSALVKPYVPRTRSAHRPLFSKQQERTLAHMRTAFSLHPDLRPLGSIILPPKVKKENFTAPN